MGVYLRLAVSSSVTEEEWESVYNESMKMVKAFNLSEINEKNISGNKVYCYTKAKEYSTSQIFNGKIVDIKRWSIVGDYETLQDGETFTLCNNLEFCKRLVAYKLYSNSKDKNEDIYESDASFGVLPDYTDEYNPENQFDTIYNIWDYKTQGQSHHVYILAIACMIESRLGKKAFVSGDNDYELCVYAVSLANKILKTPITLPCCCNSYELISRINSASISVEDKSKLFSEYYIGKEYIPKESLNAYFNGSVTYEQLNQEICLIRDDDEDDEEDEDDEYIDEDDYFENCDIKYYDDLIFYTSKDIIHPQILKSLFKFFAYYINFSNEQHCKCLMNGTPESLCKYLAEKSFDFIIRDKDWKKIFDDIKNDKTSFVRYYPMYRFNIWYEDVKNVITSIIINDDFYNLCKAHTKIYKTFRKLEEPMLESPLFID